ncbi:hypothetical protein [Streptomonospora sp. PA3]|uniref:hypothetical protein n=1 Tax=Streptomonospora sp. PA3 TaxID=2607326 RepID=UPI0012DEDD5C|nr:hypothetical protein [Streptomonospora sp. PA3]
MPAREPAAGPVGAAAALCILALLGGCGAAPDSAEEPDGASPSPVQPPPSATGGMGAESTEPTAPPKDIFVFNTHGNEQGEADRRPENLVASPSTTFTDVQWATWGGGPAIGTGEVSGTWCLPECQEKPYPVTVELSGADIVDGTAFYTRYSFRGREGFPEGMRGRVREVGSGLLTLPSAW